MNEERKSIFITGAASGMGRATARLFAKKGWYIGAVDVNKEGLDSLCREIGEENCFAHVLDVRDISAYEGVMKKFGEKSNGRLDILFNNAGIGAGGFFEEIPYEKTIEVIQVNLIGVVNGIYAALPLLKAAENSLCFTTSSSAATYGSPMLAIYAATKHAVKGLTEALSIEFRRHTIRAADVLPALIDTPILNNTPLYLEGQVVPREGRVQDGAPDKGIFRLIQPEAVAECVWNAYHSDRLHWYVPDELKKIDREKGESPEGVREGYATGSIFAANGVE
jgi:NAD(P)-dependent dehydrogenase (short-subunit alcohol dehydrogenase family)